MVLVKILVFALSIVLAVLILKYTEPLVRTVGKSSWAERHLGMGGTYTMWKVIALLILLGSLVWLFGFPGGFY